MILFLPKVIIYQVERVNIMVRQQTIIINIHKNSKRIVEFQVYLPSELFSRGRGIEPENGQILLHIDTTEFCCIDHDGLKKL